MAINIGTRINRITYFGLYSFFLALFTLLTLFLKLVVVPGTFIFTLFFTWLTPNTFTLLVCILSFLIGMLFTVIKAKRLHDFNFSGWWALIVFIPIVNLIFTLIIFFVPGTPGENKFGNQPKSASLRYKLMGLIFPIIIVTMFWLYYLGPTTKFTSRAYHSKYYSIEFPGPYKVTNQVFLDVPYEDVYCDHGYILYTVDVVDYHENKISNKALLSLIHEMGLKNSLSESLTVNPELFVKKVVIDNEDAKNIQILSDKPIYNTFIKGRLLIVKFSYEGERYVKAATYIDEVNRKYYLISAYYSNNSKHSIELKNVDYFLNSFKLYSNNNIHILQ